MASPYFYFYPVGNIQAILKQYWGFDAFRPLQEDIINSVLAGNDTLALLPTGGGKSLCFQVPAMAMEGLCLVVSPLIALMKDQVHNLNRKGIKAAAVYSGLNYREMDALLDNCIYGGYKFLYILPERLATDDFRTRMGQMKICLLAIDEAHCISQWGYDFRPPYLRIAEVREKLKGVPVIALTATATPKVVTDIQEKLLFKKPNAFRKSFVRPNLSYVVRQTINKEQSLLEILNKVKGSAVVYVRNRKKTREYSDMLNRHGIKSDYYHAGLEPDVRSAKQDDWIKNKTRVICCTNAFGMGIDKPDVRLVVHLDLPDNPEAYFQEAGRAGRDEKKAYAVLLVEKSDLISLQEKLEENFPETAFIKQVYDETAKELRIAYHDGEGRSFDFDVALFARAKKWNPVKVLAALKLLEQQKFIYLTEGVYQQSQVKAVATKDALYRFQTSHVQLEPLIKFLLRTSEGVFEDYVHVDEHSIAVKLKTTAAEISKQLEALNKFNIFNYHPRKNSPQIIFTQPRQKIEDLRLDFNFINERRHDFESRLLAMKNYVQDNNTCRTRLLVSYFGEEIQDDCGICDVCVARKKSGLSSNEFDHIVKDVEKLLKQGSVKPALVYQQINQPKEKITNALEFLLEAGQITKTNEGTLQWVE